MADKIQRRAMVVLLGDTTIETTCGHCGHKARKDFSKSKKPGQNRISRQMLECLVPYWNRNGGCVIKCTCKGTPHTNTSVGACCCGYRRQP